MVCDRPKWYAIQWCSNCGGLSGRVCHEHGLRLFKHNCNTIRIPCSWHTLPQRPQPFKHSFFIACLRDGLKPLKYHCFSIVNLVFVGGYGQHKPPVMLLNRVIYIPLPPGGHSIAKRMAKSKQTKTCGMNTICDAYVIGETCYAYEKYVLGKHSQTHLHVPKRFCIPTLFTAVLCSPNGSPTIRRTTTNELATYEFRIESAWWLKVKPFFYSASQGNPQGLLMFLTCHGSVASPMGENCCRA